MTFLLRKKVTLNYQNTLKLSEIFEQIGVCENNIEKHNIYTYVEQIYLSRINSLRILRAVRFYYTMCSYRVSSLEYACFVINTARRPRSRTMVQEDNPIARLILRNSFKCSLFRDAPLMLCHCNTTAMIIRSKSTP